MLFYRCRLGRMTLALYQGMALAVPHNCGNDLGF